MQRLTKFLVLGMTLALFATLVMPLMAQEGGSGGPIVESNIGDDPATFNPLFSSDTTSSDVWANFYPAIISADPVTLEPAPNVAGGLASGWEYDETGTVLTLSLREDAFWSDGTQITADDYIWAVEATISGILNTPRTSAFYSLADGSLTEGPIHEITKIDDFTLEIRLGNVVTDDNGEVVLDADGNPELTTNCDALNSINDVTVVPAHVYSEAFGEDYAAMEEDPYFFPSTDNGPATFGPFTDPFIEFGVQVSLLADQNYPDTQLGAVIPQEWIMQQVEDTTVEFERFLAGDFSIIGVSADQQNSFRGDENFQFIEYPANGYTYLGYNLADPTNPQPGRDPETGELLDQGIHPVLGDVLVRQAFAYGVDVRSIIGQRPDGDNPATGILEGNGFPQATHNHPGLSSVDPGVDPYEYNPERAAELLAEAGWVDTDDDGILECESCLYAETVDASFVGSELEFELLTNAGNNLRERTGETIREQLGDLGVVVNYQAIEFGTLVDELLSQEFDALIIGWNLAIPFNAGDSILSLFGIANDRPNAGFNYTSYQNPDMEAMIRVADGLPAAEDGSYPACDETVRNETYAEAMRMMYEDQPYLWLYAGNVMVAAQGNIENFDPLPYNASWNIDAWTIDG